MLSYRRQTALRDGQLLAEFSATYYYVCVAVSFTCYQVTHNCRHIYDVPL